MENRIKIEDPEIIAINEVYTALKDLDSDARLRVLNYVSNKFNIQTSGISPTTEESKPSTPPDQPSPIFDPKEDEELEGISPAGRKWITRNGITPAKLMKIFSLGIDEIDLVSKSVPGKGKSQKMRNVFLLKGIAAYLGTGAPRFTHDVVKETCLHYDAFDSSNFAQNFKTMSAEVSGSKETGYILTAKGLTEATALIKNMTSSD